MMEQRLCTALFSRNLPKTMGQTVKMTYWFRKFSLKNLQKICIANCTRAAYDFYKKNLH